MSQANWSKVLHEITQNNIAPVYLIHGPEKMIHRQCTAELKRRLLLPGSEAINCNEFDGSTTSWLDVVAALETPPLFGTHRLVIVHQPVGLTKDVDNDPTPLLTYLDNPEPQAVLLLLAGEKADRRRKLFQRIDKVGRTVAAEAPKGRELISWLRERGKQHGLQLSAEVAAAIIDRCPADLMLLDNELAKCAAYKAGASRLSLEEVELLLPVSRSETIFRWLDAVTESHTYEAIELLRRLLKQGEPAMMILHMIARHFRLLLQVKSMAERNLGFQDIQRELKVHPFALRKAMAQARVLPREQLQTALQAVLQADCDIKTGRFQEEAALEILTIRSSRGQTDQTIRRTERVVETTYGTR